MLPTFIATGALASIHPMYDMKETSLRLVILHIDSTFAGDRLTK